MTVVATPLALLFTVVVLLPEKKQVALPGPESAVKVTGTPWIGFEAASVTVAENAAGKSLPTGVLWPPPLVATRPAGTWPTGTLLSESEAEAKAPPPEAVAVLLTVLGDELGILTLRLSVG